MIARWITFEIEFLNKATLPKWKGRIIRGFLGMILKKTFCRIEGIECEDCVLNRRCPYGYLYRSTSNYMFLRKIKHITKPYSLKPPLDEREEYRRGDRISFSIVLFGRANDFLINILNAVQQGTFIGIGRKNLRGQYIVRRVYLENPLRNKKEILFEEGEIYKSKVEISFNDLNKRIRKEFTIKFLTPFRLIRENSLLTDFDFSDLFSFLIRKYSTTLRFHCGVEPKENFRKLKEISKNIGVISRSFILKKFIYSRNGKEVEEHYLLGEIKFYSPFRIPKEIRRILNFGMLSNVGKRTTFGHGWYVIN